MQVRGFLFPTTIRSELLHPHTEDNMLQKISDYTVIMRAVRDLHAQTMKHHPLTFIVSVG